MQGGERRILGKVVEVFARRKDGTTVPIELSVSEIEPRRMFTGVMRDITERRANEARLRQSDRLASLGALAAGLGHDMNNVLFPVRAHLNALAADAAEPGAATRRDHVAQIARGIEYLQKQRESLADRQAALITIAVEALALDVFQCQKRAAVLIDPCIVKPSNIRMLKRAQNVTLARHATSEILGPGQPRQLQGDFTFERTIGALGQPYRTHTAVADFLLDERKQTNDQWYGHPNTTVTLNLTGTTSAGRAHSGASRKKGLRTVSGAASRSAPCPK